MPKTRGNTLDGGVLYRDGHDCIAPLSKTQPILYAWRYDAAYGEGDRRRVSLGTRDLKVAVERLKVLQDFDFDKDRFRAFLKGGATPEAQIDLDPLIADLMADFVELAENAGAWRGQARMITPTIAELCSDTRVSRLTPRLQKAIIKHLYDRGYAPNTVIGMAQFIARVVNWGSEPDDDDVVRCLARPKIINSPFKVCKVLNVPVPEPDNWSPAPADMGRVLASVADDEPVRRWCLLVLAFASRVEPGLEATGEQLIGEMYYLNPEERRQEDTKHRAANPVPWSALAEMRTWGPGPWVGLTNQALGKRLTAVDEQLGLGGRLKPSCFRDYACEAMRHADVDFPVRSVSLEQRELWMGHRRMDVTNNKYGRIRPDFRIRPRVATEAFLRDLDARSGGALFRQGPDKTPLRELYPPRPDELVELAYWREKAMAYERGKGVSDKDEEPDPGSSGIQSDLAVSGRVASVIVGGNRGGIDADGGFAGSFRQISDNMYDDLNPLDRPFPRPLLEALEEYGIRLYEADPWTTGGRRGIFVVAPVDRLVPRSTVAALIRVAEPRRHYPKRVSNAPKIGRLKRLRAEGAKP